MFLKSSPDKPILSIRQMTYFHLKRLVDYCPAGLFILSLDSLTLRWQVHWNQSLLILPPRNIRNSTVNLLNTCRDSQLIWSDNRLQPVGKSNQQFKSYFRNLFWSKKPNNCSSQPTSILVSIIPSPIVCSNIQ